MHGINANKTSQIFTVALINISSESGGKYIFNIEIRSKKGVLQFQCLFDQWHVCTVLLLQDVFCGYDEDKVYTYIFYRDTVIGELFLFFLCLHVDRSKYDIFWTETL